MYNAWMTAVRLSWAVPRETRTFLVQQVLSSGLTFAKVDIMARYGWFYRSLILSPSYEVAVLAGIVGDDLRSTTGSNLRLLMELTGLDPKAFGSARIREEFKS